MTQYSLNLVDCPLRVRRGILHSLQRTACSRVSRERARRAAEILTEVRNSRISDRSGNPIGPTESTRADKVPASCPRSSVTEMVLRILFAPIGWIYAAVRHVCRRRSR
jgi:hypothetical protein